MTDKPDFTKASGGSNRNWTKRYKKMLATFKILKKVKADKKIIKGYKMCMDTFTGELEND